MNRVFCIGNGESRKHLDLETLRPHGKIYGCNAIYRDFMPDVLTAVDHGIMHEIYHAGVAQKIPCYFRDWTKVPAMTYEPMLMGGITNLEEAKDALDKVLITNEKGDSQEYVMHGSNIQGIVNMIKREPDKFKKDIMYLEKKEINHATIKVSWIKEPDFSHSLTDICVENNGNGLKRDFGWACGASAGYVAIHREQPDEVYLLGHDIKSNDNHVNNLFAGTKHYVAPENAPTPGVNWEQQWCNLIKEFPRTKFIKVNPNADRGPDNVSQPVKLWSIFVGKNVFYTDYPGLAKMVGL